MNKPTVQTINSFLQNLVNKDYREANVSLHKVVEEKIKEKIQGLSLDKKSTNLDK